MIAYVAMEEMTPPTQAKRRAMQAQRVRDTQPELDIRRALHSLGLRYRLQQPVVPGTRRRVDIVFRPARVAVDVRGCFWHGCPLHSTVPTANGEWWLRKLTSNKERDADTERRLREADWEFIVVWEHEIPMVAAERIHEVIRFRRLKT
jgi:DNA mismatch endonuclease (patch repair protein)